METEDEELQRKRLSAALEQIAQALFAHIGCEHTLVELSPGVTLLVRIERLEP